MFMPGIMEIGIILLILIFLVFVIGLILFFVFRMAGAGNTNHEADISELHNLTTDIENMEGRMENIETILSGKEEK